MMITLKQLQVHSGCGYKLFEKDMGLLSKPMYSLCHINNIRVILLASTEMTFSFRGQYSVYLGRFSSSRVHFVYKYTDKMLVSVDSQHVKRRKITWMIKANRTWALLSKKIFSHSETKIFCSVLKYEFIY